MKKHIVLFLVIFVLSYSCKANADPFEKGEMYGDLTGGISLIQNILPTAANDSYNYKIQNQSFGIGLDAGYWYDLIPWLGSRMEFFDSMANYTVPVGLKSSPVYLSTNGGTESFIAFSFDLATVRMPEPEWLQDWGFLYAFSGLNYQVAPVGAIGWKSGIGVRYHWFDTTTVDVNDGSITHGHMDMFLEYDYYGYPNNPVYIGPQNLSKTISNQFMNLIEFGIGLSF